MKRRTAVTLLGPGGLIIADAFLFPPYFTQYLFYGLIHYLDLHFEYRVHGIGWRRLLSGRSNCYHL